MKKTGDTNHRREQGSALALILVVAVVLLLVGNGLLGLGLQSQTLTIRSCDEILARCSADAGLAQAVQMMNECEGGDLPSMTDESLLNCDATFGFSISGSAEDGYVVTSIGVSGSREKTVSCILEAQAGDSLWVGVCTQGSVELKNGSIIASSPLGQNVQVHTNSTSSNTIEIGFFSSISGDVVVGPEGNPSTVIDNIHRVTGSTSTATEDMPFVPFSPPEGLADRGSITGNTTITEDGRYSEIDLSNWKTISIEDNVTIYVEGEVRLKTGSKLEVADGCSLDLYVDGDIELKSFAKIKSQSNDPTQIRIYGTSTCGDIALKTLSSAQAAVYAPNADLDLNSFSAFVGAFMGNSVLLGSLSGFFYDPDVGDLAGGPRGGAGGSSSFSILRWQE